MKKTGTRSTDDIVREFINNGGRGTCNAIAKSLGIKPPTVYACLRRLDHAGDAAIVARHPVHDSFGRFRKFAHVYGLPAKRITAPMSLVERAVTWRHLNDGIHSAWWPIAAVQSQGVAAC